MKTASLSERMPCSARRCLLQDLQYFLELTSLKCSSTSCCPPRHTHLSLFPSSCVGMLLLGGGGAYAALMQCARSRAGTSLPLLHSGPAARAPANLGPCRPPLHTPVTTRLLHQRLIQNSVRLTDESDAVFILQTFFQHSPAPTVSSSKGGSFSHVFSIKK